LFLGFGLRLLLSSLFLRFALGLQSPCLLLGLLPGFCFRLLTAIFVVPAQGRLCLLRETVAFSLMNYLRYVLRFRLRRAIVVVRPLAIVGRIRR